MHCDSFSDVAKVSCRSLSLHNTQLGRYYRNAEFCREIISIQGEHVKQQLSVDAGCSPKQLCIAIVLSRDARRLANPYPKLIYNSRTTLSQTHISHDTIKMQSSFQLGSTPMERRSQSDSQWILAHLLKERCIAIGVSTQGLRL